METSLEDLSEAMESEKCHYKIISGDFNAKIGQKKRSRFRKHWMFWSGHKKPTWRYVVGISKQRKPILSEYLFPEIRTEEMDMEKPRRQNQERDRLHTSQ